MSSFLMYSYLNPIRFFQVAGNDRFTFIRPSYIYEKTHYQYFIETEILCFQLSIEQEGLDLLYQVWNTDTRELIYWTNIPQLPGGLIREEYYVYQYNAPIIGNFHLITENIPIQIHVTILAPKGNIILQSELIEIFSIEYLEQISESTLAIACTDIENKHDFLFTHKNSGITLLRVEGKIIKSDNEYKITLGGIAEPPLWIVEKVNRLLSLKRIKINGENYINKDKRNLVYIKDDPEYPKGKWIIELLKSENP